MSKPTRTKCGTPSGYTRHQLDGTPTCPECKAARAAYMTEYRNNPVVQARDRLYAKAQTYAKTQLTREYPERYRELYDRFKAELTEAPTKGDAQ